MAKRRTAKKIWLVNYGKTMKALITGGAGFIGSHLVELCLKKGYEVSGIDNFSTGSKNNLFGEANNIEADIRTFDFESLPKADIIFHLAAFPGVQQSIENPIESNSVNIGGSLRILEYARSHSIPIVFSSTSAVYGDANIKPTSEGCGLQPMSPYALQKITIEKYLKLYGELYELKSVSLRYFNVFGERQPNAGAYKTVLSAFLEQYKKGEPFTIVGDGTQSRDFVYVKDVAEANIKAGELLLQGIRFGAINIGSGRNYNINQIADLIDAKHPRITLPPRIEPHMTLAHINIARECLGWKQTITLEQWINNIKTK